MITADIRLPLKHIAHFWNWTTMDD